MHNSKKDKAQSIISASFAIAFLSACICLFFLLKANVHRNGAAPEKISFSISDDIETAVRAISIRLAERITELPKVYAVPIESYVSPKPKNDNYQNNFSRYSDDTITAEYYSENHFGSKFHFIEVTIAHPSQLRMALAGNEFGKKRMYPQSIALKVNAVAAVNGSHYNVRNNGVIYYQGKMYRSKAVGWQTLLIDSNGDFHILIDKDIVNGDIEKDYKIINSVTFGPALVLNSEVQSIHTAYGFPNDLEPRAAIAQIGKLHYLLCTVDGRQGSSPGVTQHQLATVLADKGCNIAYNLDGGQSATLLMGGHVKNNVAYGGQRKLGDILYFCTALPENVES